LIDEIKEDEMGRACIKHRVERHSYKILVENPEGKSPLRRTKRTCEIIFTWILE
jgi:hypothetical protein